MELTMLKSKIHRATVTCANIDYEGSIAIDRNLIEAAKLLPFEKVEIYNITNGNRFSTYVIEDEANSGTISINGAAAHLAKEGDLIIIACYGSFDESEAQSHTPTLVYVNDDNTIKNIKGTLTQAVNS